MKRMMLYCTTALLAAGCLSSDDTRIRSTLTFDMNVHGAEWLFGAADFPEAQLPAVGVVGDFRALPAPFTGGRSGLYLKGTNVSGDLFMFQTKYFSGLTPNTSYQASLEAEFATSYDGGCTTGPGPVTFLKMGATGLQPLVSADQQGVLRFNFDKGTGSSGGDFVSGGDIRNSNSGCPGTATFNGRITQIRNQTSTLTTDLNGGIWLWVGTQSSFVGDHEIYIIAMRLTIQ